MKLIVKKIDIEPDFKAKINESIGKKTLDITYYNGYLVEFEKCNIQSISPHKIVVSNSEKNLLILSYADYVENDELYFIDGFKDPFTITKLKEFVNNYF